MRCSAVGTGLCLLALAGGVLPAAAQGDSLQGCRTTLQDLYPEEAGVQLSEACQVLAGELLGALTDHLWPSDVAEATGDGDVQPVAAGASTAAGSAGQSEALASGQPVGAGGGSISIVGTDGGTDGIASFSFNPWVFFGGDREAAARRSRFSDVTLFFPMNDVDGDEDGEVDYFGARLRINFTGLSAGDSIWRAAQSNFEHLLAQEFEVLDALRNRLSGMSPAEIRACAEAIRGRRGAAAVESQCGAGLAAPPATAYRSFQTSLDRARVKADSRYFGLDLRMETGDPTLGAVENASVNSVNAGVSFGRQFVGEEPDLLAASSGFRLRASVRYAELTDLDETAFAFEAGGAFVLKRPITVDQALTLSGGVELRAGESKEEMEEQFQSDFLSLRASLSIPVTRQTAISIAFGHPVWGDEVSPALSISGDWRLGLEELLTRGGS